MVPWCTRSPREMGRNFRCSDNIFDLDMGSAACRAMRPNPDAPTTVDDMDQHGSDIDNDIGSSNDVSATSTQTQDEAELAITTTGGLSESTAGPTGVTPGTPSTTIMHTPTAPTVVTDGNNSRAISAWTTRPTDGGDAQPQYIRL